MHVFEREREYMCEYMIVTCQNIRFALVHTGASAIMRSHTHDTGATNMRLLNSACTNMTQS